jgi:zinc transporter 1
MQLGNVGVIGAGLIIWLTKSPYRFYSDPVISFIITIIIFSSALPLGMSLFSLCRIRVARVYSDHLLLIYYLVRSASFILLQGTPAHVPLEKVRHAILKIPNVISVHGGFCILIRFPILCWPEILIG